MDSPAKNSKGTPQPRRLSYSRGDLIIKEGDYGISIYQIISGTAEAYTEEGGMNIRLATLGPGELVGEMVFLGAAAAARSASVRAIEDCELEVWHAASLSKEYREMPSMLKYIWDHTLRRIVRMNRMIADMSVNEAPKKSRPPSAQEAARRKYYRKRVSIQCTYRPVSAPERFALRGLVTDLSKNGLGMEVSARNLLECYHNPGDAFLVRTVLPNGKGLEVTAEITSIRRGESISQYVMGMSFARVTEENAKKLGFFLMG